MHQPHPAAAHCNELEQQATWAWAEHPLGPSFVEPKAQAPPSSDTWPTAPDQGQPQAPTQPPLLLHAEQAIYGCSPEASLAPCHLSLNLQTWKGNRA